MTEQEIYVLNALSGKPAADVTKIAYLIPDLIKAVEESGWIKIDEDHQPPKNELVRIWNDAYKEEMTGKYIPRFWVNTEDQPFEGDTEYDEESDSTYWPEGWYVFCEHVAIEYVYGLCLDNITHYKPLVQPSFLKVDE